MRRQRLFAAGVSVALLLGVSAPAMAKSDKGKGKGQDKPPKTAPAPKPKKVKTSVSGGGTVAAGAFSVQAGNGKSKGHFNYTTTDGTYKLRCHGVVLSVSGNTATVTDSDCRLSTGPEGARQVKTVSVNAVFTDNGQPAETQPPTAGPDRITFTVDGVAVVSDASVTGNVKVRPKP